MDLKNTIIDKFMKTAEHELSNEIPAPEIHEPTNTGHVPDEFTNSLVTGEGHSFPSISDIPVEESDNYTYLDNDELSRDFLLDRDLTNTYSMQLVMFHKNTSMDTPFLEFYLEKTDNMYQFPTKELNNEQLNEMIEQIEQTQYGGADIKTTQHEDIEMGTKTTLTETETLNPFEHQVFTFFNENTGYSHIVAENTYKGFVENDTTLYVLFENKDKDSSAEKENYMWVLLDEVMKKETLTLPIHDSVREVFLHHPEVAYIKLNDNPVDIPLIIYPVDKVNEIYENIYYTKEQAEQAEQAEQETFLITLPIENEELGRVFLFTTDILPSNHDVHSIKRMVTFSQNAMYTLDKPTRELFDKYPIVRFKEDDVDIWGISNYLLFMELL